MGIIANRDIYKSKNIKGIICFIILFFFCILPVFKGLFLDSKVHVEAISIEPQPVSLKNSIVEQEIHIEGKVSNFKVSLLAPNKTLYGDAYIKFSLQQDDTQITKTIRAEDLVVFDNMVNFNFNKINKGKAILTIEGVGIAENTDVFCYVTGAKGTGLKNAFVNDSILPGPLVLNYDVLRHDTYFFYEIILLVLLVLLIAVTTYLLTYKNITKYLFFISFGLIFLYVSLTNPLASFFAEPSSEMAYEFWYKAHNYGFLRNSMSLMSGESLVWTERLLMWLADRMTGGGRYVFVVAQLFQLSLISAFASMFCLPKFKKYFSDTVRLIVSFYIGTMLLFPSAYYFWAVSYWVSLFLIFFAFIDMKKLRKTQYLLLLGITIVLCVSRIYHIVYIPISLFLIVMFGKEKGKRFFIYCSTVAISSLFEVLYSLTMGGQDHFTHNSFSILRAIENTIYYQVQVLISFFMGNGAKNGLITNIFFLVILILFAGLFIYKLITNQGDKKPWVIIGAFGILSIGTIAINIVVCTISATVGFPYDYAKKIDWNTCYYQNGDLHFSYAYFALVGLVLVTVYLYKKHNKLENDNFPIQKVEYILVFILMFNMMTNTYTKIPLRMVPTQWQSVYQTTKKDSYYLAINTTYPFANISLTQNSEPIIIARDDMDNTFLWTTGMPQYNTSTRYNSLNTSGIVDLAGKEILTVTVSRTDLNFDTPYILVLKDKDGNVIDKIKQANSPKRQWTDFLLPENTKGVTILEFEYEDGTKAYIHDAIQIGAKI